MFFYCRVSHRKLDRSTSETEIAEENNYRVLEKYVRLVTITSTSPKAVVAASKLVPRKEKVGSQGFKMISKTTYHS